MDFHIREQIIEDSGEPKTVNVIWHIHVPDINNAAGVSYRSAIVDFLGGVAAINSVVADPAELEQMQLGAVYEIAAPMRFSRLGLTNAEKLAEIQAFYASGSAAILAQLQAKLLYWGYEGDAS